MHSGKWVQRMLVTLRAFNRTKNIRQSRKIDGNIRVALLVAVYWGHIAQSITLWNVCSSCWKRHSTSIYERVHPCDAHGVCLFSFIYTRRHAHRVSKSGSKVPVPVNGFVIKWFHTTVYFFCEETPLEKNFPPKFRDWYDAMCANFGRHCVRIKSQFRCCSLKMSEFPCCSLCMSGVLRTSAV